jgi:hypothetical protein
MWIYVQLRIAGGPHLPGGGGGAAAPAPLPGRGGGVVQARSGSRSTASPCNSGSRATLPCEVDNSEVERIHCLRLYRRRVGRHRVLTWPCSYAAVKCEFWWHPKVPDPGPPPQTHFRRGLRHLVPHTFPAWNDPPRTPREFRHLATLCHAGAFKSLRLYVTSTLRPCSYVTALRRVYGMGGPLRLITTNGP